MKENKTALFPDFWRRLLNSPSYRQFTALFQNVFKRSLTYVPSKDAFVSLKELERINASFGKSFAPLPFCQLIGNTREGRQCCKKEEERMLENITTGQTGIITCYTGLTDAMIPIRSRGKICGCIAVLGGFLLEPPSETSWQEIVRKVKDTGVDLNALKQAYFQIRPVSRGFLQAMLKTMEVIVTEVTNAIVMSEEQHQRITRLESTLFEKYRFANIIGQSKPMRKVFQLLEQIKDTESPILIQGETGTGKELVAQAIHYQSLRKDKPLLTQNCAAISESLLESELFGHVKGAFTGAIKDKRGLFELADGGSLFLDEIIEIPLGTQAKFLRVIEQGEFRRLGAERITKVNVRIISSTHQDLKTLVQEGRFREDLYYRIKGTIVVLLPLRQRKEDIPFLISHFLKKNEEKTKKKLKLTKETLRLLCDYDWPGNVRELENEIKRVVFLAKETITPDILSGEIKQSVKIIDSKDIWNQFKGKTLREASAEVEKELLLRTLKQTRWNQVVAAKILGIPRTTLQNKLRTYDLKQPID